MELISSLKFIKRVDAEEETSKEQILHGLKDAVDEVNLIKSGKKKSQPLGEFLDGL